MPVDSDESLRLKPGKVAGNQFANRTNLRRQFLVAHAQPKSKLFLILRFDAISRKSGGYAQ